MVIAFTFLLYKAPYFSSVNQYANPGPAALRLRLQSTKYARMRIAFVGFVARHEVAPQRILRGAPGPTTLCCSRNTILRLFSFCSTERATRGLIKGLVILVCGERFSSSGAPGRL